MPNPARANTNVVPYSGVRPAVRIGPLDDPLNWWDYSLIAERLEFLNAAESLGPFNVCGQGNPWKYVAPPWETKPTQGVRFNPTGQVQPNALAIGVQKAVTAQTINIGLDAVIDSIVCNFYPTPGGTQLLQGSGWLTWTLAINSYVVNGYGQIVTEIGSLTTDVPLIGGGIRAYSGDTITLYVLMNAAGQASLDPNGQIVCKLGGWTWPR